MTGSTSGTEPQSPQPLDPGPSPTGTTSPLAESQTSAWGNSPEQILAQTLSQAQQNCREGRWSQVIRLCEQVIEQCQQRLQQQAGDRPDSDLALDSQPDGTSLGEFYRVKGDVLRQEGNLAAAFRAYEQALQHQPDQVDLQVAIAQVYSKKQQWQRAIEHYETALACLDDKAAATPKIRQHLGKAYAALGQQCKSQGDTAGAGAAYLKALEYHPQLNQVYVALRYDVLGHYTIAATPANQQLLEQAIDRLQAIVNDYPDLALAHTTLAHALTQAGEIEAAAQRYRQINTQVARQHHPEPQLWENAQYRLPDFIIIGTQKSGTTSLFQYLRCHPQILSPIEKEINFFSWEYGRGYDWYASHFPPLPQQGHWLTGEVSPHYFYGLEAPERIAERLPQVKLGVILRNPIDRAISHYHMQVRKGEESRSFAEVIAEEIEQLQPLNEGKQLDWKVVNQCSYLGRGLYHFHLQRWLKLFPRDQIWVMNSEDLLTKTDQVLTGLYEFLGIKPESRESYTQHHVGAYAALEEEQRQQLNQFFASQNCQLEDLLDRSLGW